MSGEKGDARGRAPLSSRSQQVDSKSVSVREDGDRVHRNTEVSGLGGGSGVCEPRVGLRSGY